MCRFHFDATSTFQTFGISKRNTRNASAMPAWVDANNEFALLKIGIIFFVKPSHDNHGFWIIHIGIEHIKTIRKLTLVLYILIRSEERRVGKECISWWSRYG